MQSNTGARVRFENNALATHYDIDILPFERHNKNVTHMPRSRAQVSLKVHEYYIRDFDSDYNSYNH